MWDSELSEFCFLLNCGEDMANGDSNVILIKV